MRSVNRRLAPVLIACAALTSSVGCKKHAPDPAPALFARAADLLAEDPSLRSSAKTTSCKDLIGHPAKPGRVPASAPVTTLQGATRLELGGLDYDDLVLVFERDAGPPYVIVGCAQGGPGSVTLTAGKVAFWVYGWSLSVDQGPITVDAVVGTSSQRDQLQFDSNLVVDREYLR